MNLKEILSNIGQNILLGILILGFMFVIVGIIGSSINWLFIAIGIIIMIPFIIGYLNNENETMKFAKEKEKEFHQFLKTADRVEVLLDNVIIKEKKHTQTRDVDQDYRAAGINEITGNGQYNEERITHTYCEVTFKANYKEQTLIYKDIIHKDEASIRMHFYMKKSTIMYVNPNNTTEYQLDLAFLND